MPASAIAARDATAESTTYMDSEMTKANLIAVLEDLRFSRRGEPLQVIALDRQVRDYLLNALRSK